MMDADNDMQYVLIIIYTHIRYYQTLGTGDALIMLERRVMGGLFRRLLLSSPFRNLYISMYRT